MIHLLVFIAVIQKKRYDLHCLFFWAYSSISDNSCCSMESVSVKYFTACSRFSSTRLLQNIVLMPCDIICILPALFFCKPLIVFTKAKRHCCFMGDRRKIIRYHSADRGGRDSADPVKRILPKVHYLIRQDTEFSQILTSLKCTFSDRCNRLGI